MCITLTFATANVLTLDAGTSRQQCRGLLQQGRIANLQAQFGGTRCNVIGVQEARTQGSNTRHSASHLVYQSGADSEGVRGCELWLDRSKPYAANSKRQFCFQPQHVHIASFSDRHLLAIIKAPYLQIRVLVVHAPYQGANDTELQAWWDFIQDMLAHANAAIPLVVFGDMNARLGSVVSSAVGHCGAEEESATGHFVHAFLLEHSLFAPSTHHQYHEGDSMTWIAPCGQEHRLDFVFLPQDWATFTIKSYVHDGIDLALARHDHLVAAVDVIMIARTSSVPEPKRCRLDTRKIASKANRDQFLAYLRCPPYLSWSIGVGFHAEVLTEWLQTGAQACFAFDRQLPRQRYMSEATWSIVQLRKQLLQMHRNALLHMRRVRAKIFLCRWTTAYRRKQFHQFASVSSPVCVQQLASEVLVSLRRLTLWTLHCRRQLHSQMRHMSKQDRIATATRLVENFQSAAATTDTNKLYRALKPLLGQACRRNQQFFRPIPAVKLESGALAKDHCEAAERWRSYFAKSEQGRLATVADLQHALHSASICYKPAELPFDLAAVPRLQDIEEYIMRAKKRKSPGIDGLPAEIYQIDPAAFAKLLWPVMAKSSIRCTEPLRWKGGEVCALPKTTAAGHVVDKYRSILLADFMSKIAHGLTRQKLLPNFLDFKHSMQAGGVPALSTDMLNLYVQSFAQYTRVNGLSSAALFVDIQQAFYTACRPLLVTHAIHEEELASLFSANGWTADMYREFQAHLREPTALAQAEVSPHLQAQVSSMLTATWFRMRGSPDTLTATQSGTRPGDSVADLLYAFLMTRFLSGVKADSERAGLHTTFELHWIPACALQPGDLPDSNSKIMDASWVDDLVLLLQARTPESLLHKTQQALSIVYDQAAALCLRLNLDQDKTSVVLSLRGAASRKIWAQILRDDPLHPKLTFTCCALPKPARVSIVADYVYLGVLQDQQGHPACEVKRRFLSIQAVRKMLNKNIFKSPKMPASTRKLLFKSSRCCLAK